MQGSHRTIRPFELHRPQTLDEVVALLDRLDGKATLMSGGIDLLQRLKAGYEAGHLVYLRGVAELRQVQKTPTYLRVGSGITHRDLEKHPAIEASVPQLTTLWAEVANVRVRSVGTLGGNLMTGNPDYDLLPMLIALDAHIVFRDKAGEKRLSALQTINLQGEKLGLLTAIEIPLLPGRRLAFDRTLKPVVSVAVAVERNGAEVTAIRAGIGCAYPTPTGGALPIPEENSPAAIGARAERIAAEFAAQLADPMTNVYASSQYRRRMIAVLLGRQIARLVGKPEN